MSKVRLYNHHTAILHLPATLDGGEVSVPAASKHGPGESATTVHHAESLRGNPSVRRWADSGMLAFGEVFRDALDDDAADEDFDSSDVDSEQEPSDPELSASPTETAPASEVGLPPLPSLKKLDQKTNPQRRSK